MTRVQSLGVLAAVGVALLALAVWRSSDGMLQVESVAPNLFVLRGEGGNTAVFVRSDSVVVVDSKNPGWGRSILEEIRKLTANPVTLVINTHSHADHTSGNVEFPLPIEIVTQVNTRANMEAMRAYTGRDTAPANVFTQHEGRGLPTRTFADAATFGVGEDRVDLYYFGRGHTDGDAWVVFPSVRTLHAGDLFPGKGLPFLDAANGGSGVALPETLQMGVETIQNVDTVITGHSGQMTWADLREFVLFNRDFLQYVREARDAGQTADEAARNWTLPLRYFGFAEPPAGQVLSNVRVVYDELSGRAR